MDEPNTYESYFPAPSLPGGDVNKHMNGHSVVDTTSSSAYSVTGDNRNVFIKILAFARGFARIHIEF